MEDILKFTDSPIIVESIEEYEYHEYEPITGTNLNDGGDIGSIESQDVLTHPSESYLIFEGRLTKAASAAYANADEVALTNNAICIFLAELSITYQTSWLNHLTIVKCTFSFRIPMKHIFGFCENYDKNCVWLKTQPNSC